MSIDRPPGWYPDDVNHGQQRWWDGNQWTAQVAVFSPTGFAPALPAPGGTSPYTLQIWLIVAIYFLVAIIQYPYSIFYVPLLYFGDYLRPDAVHLTLSGLLGAAAAVTLAFFDRRTLESRGVAQPFHWAFALIPLYGATVYIVGRSVVARRRTGLGLAPIWVHLVSQLAGLAALTYTIFVALAFAFSGPGSYGG
jgi:hypothetical protein